MRRLHDVEDYYGSGGNIWTAGDKTILPPVYFYEIWFFSFQIPDPSLTRNSQSQLKDKRKTLKIKFEKMEKRWKNEREQKRVATNKIFSPANDLLFLSHQQNENRARLNFRTHFWMPDHVKLRWTLSGECRAGIVPQYFYILICSYQSTVLKRAKQKYVSTILGMEINLFFRS